MTDRKNSRVSKWLAVLLLLSLLAALLPLGVAAAANEIKCVYTYQVNKNSTLAKIASAYGRTTGEIAYATDLRKPYTIYVGQKLCIPDKVKSLPKAYQNISGTAKAANFVAGLTSDNKILLHPYTYPNTTVFIKVREDGGSPGKWYKIGTLTIGGSTGNGKTYTYKVPTDLQGNRSIQICLKDRTTSYLQCVKPLGQ
jgi:LysM repeat protein